MLHGRERARGREGVDGPVLAGHEGAGPHVRGQSGGFGEVGGARGGRGRRPQGAVGGVEHAQDVAALHRDGTGGQSGRGAEGDLSDVDRSDREGAEVGHGDGLGRLTHVEVGGLGAQRAVKDAGLVVEVADHLLRLVRHPDATVVDVDLGDFRAPVDDARDAECNDDQHEDGRRQASPHASQVSSRSRGHDPSLDR